MHYCTHIISCHFLVLEKNINFKCLDFMNSLWLGRREINNCKYYTVLYTILRFMKKMGLYIKIAKKCSIVNLFLCSVFLCLNLVQVHIDTCFAISNEFLLLTLKIFFKDKLYMYISCQLQYYLLWTNFYSWARNVHKVRKSLFIMNIFCCETVLAIWMLWNTEMDKAKSWK